MQRATLKETLFELELLINRGTGSGRQQLFTLVNPGQGLFQEISLNILA